MGGREKSKNMTDNSWLYWRAPSFYKDIKDCSVNPDEWLVCPSCKEKPRLWLFDHGSYAKCKCQAAYSNPAAEGKSIWEYHKEHNGDMSEWNHNDLRDNWNKYVENLSSPIQSETEVSEG